MPRRSRAERHAHDRLAADVVSANLDSLLAVAAATVEELGDSGCAQLVADARVAAELAERIDSILVLPEPLETLDRPVLFLVALAALGIHRATVNRRQRGLARELAEKHVRAANAEGR